MVRRESFFNKIRELGYSYKDQRPRITLWRKGVHFISVPRRDLLTDEFVSNSLRQAGCNEEEIQSFYRSARLSDPHL
jgi:hypothetical protein